MIRDNQIRNLVSGIISMAAERSGMVTASDLDREALEMAEWHGPHRGRPRPALARMPALRRGAIVTLAFTVMVPLFARVTYDQTVKRGSFDGALPVKSRVPSLDPPVFDIPLTMYAPPLESARPETFKIVLQGDRLVRIGKNDSNIFDLQARPITIVRPNSTRIAWKPSTKLRSASRRCS